MPSSATASAAQCFESLADACGVRDAVKFHGSLGDRDLIECYQQCDLFALPNREAGGDFEGFGMVLVEAQACGRPVLAGTSGGTAETLRPGESGRLVNCERPEPLAQALIEMLNDPKGLERMGAAARQWAVDRFDWGTLAGRAQALFAELGPGGGDVPAGAKEVKPTGVNVHPAAACSNSS